MGHVFVQVLLANKRSGASRPDLGFNCITNQLVTSSGTTIRHVERHTEQSFIHTQEVSAVKEAVLRSLTMLAALVRHLQGQEEVSQFKGSGRVVLQDRLLTYVPCHVPSR